MTSSNRATLHRQRGQETRWQQPRRDIQEEVVYRLPTKVKEQVFDHINEEYCMYVGIAVNSAQRQHLCTNGQHPLPSLGFRHLKPNRQAHTAHPGQNKTKG